MRYKRPKLIAALFAFAWAVTPLLASTQETAIVSIPIQDWNKNPSPANPHNNPEAVPVANRVAPTNAMYAVITNLATVTYTEKRDALIARFHLPNSKLDYPLPNQVRWAVTTSHGTFYIHTSFSDMMYAARFTFQCEQKTNTWVCPQFTDRRTLRENDGKPRCPACRRYCSGAKRA